MNPSNSTTCGTRFKSIVTPSGPITGSTSRVTPVFLVSNAVGVVGVIGTDVEPAATPVPVLPTVWGISAGGNSAGSGIYPPIQSQRACHFLSVPAAPGGGRTPFFGFGHRFQT